MKNIVCLLIVLAAFSVANAQDTLYNTTRESRGYGNNNKPDRPFIFSIGVEPSLPVGNFRDFSRFGLGGDLQGEYKPINALGITLSGGFINYFGRTVNGVDISDFKYIPVMGGLKWHATDVLYIHGQAGPGFGIDGLGTSFWYGGGVGITVGRGFDAELKYTGWQQDEVNRTNGTNVGNGDGTGGGNGGGGNGGGTGGTGGGIYGGHYSTISLRLAYTF